MMPSESKLLNVQQSAAFLSVNPATIRRWAKTNQLNGIKVGSRGDWRFTKEALSKLTSLPSIKEEQRKFAKIKQILLKHKNAIQKLATVHHTLLIGGDPLPDKHSSKYNAIHIKIVQAIANNLDDFEQGIQDFNVIGIELAAEAVKDGLSIEEAVDGTIFLKQAIWKKLEETGLLKELSARDVFDFSQIIGSYCDVLSSKIAFTYHNVFTEKITSFVSESKKTEEALKESEQRLRLALEAGLIGVWDWDIQEHSILWSDRVYSFYGATRKNFEVTYENVSNYIFPEDKEKVDAAVQDAIAGRQEYDIEYRILTLDGKVRWISSKALVTVDETGKPHHMLGATSDITEQKRIEQDKTDFVSIATHELKTPVTSLKAYAEVMQRTFAKAGDDVAAAHLGKMNAQLNKLASLIGGLLDSIKIDSDKLYMREEVFSLDGLVAEIVEEMQRTSDTHNIRILSLAKKNIFADRDRIGQVLTNLISNAIKYSPQANKIDVRVKTTTKDVVVSVKDYGIGIAKKKQSFVFERFYRGVGMHEITFPGLGLGLYISSEIIKREGGKIWVDSTLGHGSSFCFSLPLKNRKAQQ